MLADFATLVLAAAGIWVIYYLLFEM